jgi:phage terminase large subunit-like protein
VGRTRASRSPSPPPSRGGMVCTYIERNLVHSQGDFYGQPFRLTPEQKRFIWNAYELRPDGRRRYRRVLRGRPKGDGKTELAAAIGCVELGLAGQHGFPKAPEIPVAAASFEQADLLFGAAKAMISEGPLAPFFECFDTEILRTDGPGRMFRVAAQAGTNDGLRPTFFLADELHEWTGGKERVHLVIENGLAKRRDAWSLGISTAGSDKETLLGRLYDHGKRIEAGEIEDDGFLFDWLEAAEGFDLETEDGLLAAVLSCNPHAERFGMLEGILRRYGEVPRFEFERYNLNRWTEADDSWVSPSDWDGCAGTVALEPDQEVWLGVDIGGQKDSSAVVVVGWVDNVLHVEQWIGEPDEKHTVSTHEARARIVHAADGTPSGRWRSTGQCSARVRRSSRTEVWR